MKMIIILCSIVILFNWPVDSRMCYECSCDYDWGTSTGTCSSPTFQSSCVLVEVDNQYCSIMSYYNGNSEQRFLASVAPDTFQDSHFFQAIETISLSGTTWLPATINFFAYGCDSDGCNLNSLLDYFPESFQISINSTILNSQLIDEQSSALICESCSKCINGITVILCSPQPCTNGSCYIDEIHNYILTPTNNCTFTFNSTCQSPSDPVQTPRVRIRATYYIDFPPEKQLEIDEVDMVCKKDTCNSIVIVEDLKGYIQTTINIHPDFRPNDATTIIGTTTVKGSIVFLQLILFLLSI